MTVYEDLENKIRVFSDLTTDVEEINELRDCEIQLKRYKFAMKQELYEVAEVFYAALISSLGYFEDKYEVEGRDKLNRGVLDDFGACD